MERHVSEQSVDQLVNGLGTILKNLPMIKDSRRAVHYVGMNYELHVAELEKRRYFVLAEYYRKQWNEVLK